MFMLKMLIVAGPRRVATPKALRATAEAWPVNTAPQSGDVVLRGDHTSGVEIVDAVTRLRIAGRFRTLEAAVATARFYGAAAIWQQTVDNRGRPLGDAYRLERKPAQVG
jgi:hypothetical protein